MSDTSSDDGERLVQPCDGCGNSVGDTAGERIPVRGGHTLRLCDGCCSWAARHLTLNHLQGEEKEAAFDALKQELQTDPDREAEFGDRLAGAASTMDGEAGEFAARRPHPDAHLYHIEEGLRQRADDLENWLQEEYYR